MGRFFYNARKTLQGQLGATSAAVRTRCRLRCASKSSPVRPSG